MAYLMSYLQASVIKEFDIGLAGDVSEEVIWPYPRPIWYRISNKVCSHVGLCRI